MVLLVFIGIVLLAAVTVVSQVRAWLRRRTLRSLLDGSWQHRRS